MTNTTVDAAELEAKVKDMYRQVATDPSGDYHFELGRPLAERFGYPAGMLDQIPDDAIESFAGVGYFFDLAGRERGKSVIDLGSGSGMDLPGVEAGRTHSFVAPSQDSPTSCSPSRPARRTRRPDRQVHGALQDLLASVGTWVPPLPALTA